jgi:hypothetical protein
MRHPAASSYELDSSNLFLFLAEGPILTTDEFPPDLDTTSVGLMVTQPDDHVFDSVMDEMLRYTSQDDITMASGRSHPPMRCC